MAKARVIDFLFELCRLLRYKYSRESKVRISGYEVIRFPDIGESGHQVFSGKSAGRWNSRWPESRGLIS